MTKSQFLNCNSIINNGYSHQDSHDTRQVSSSWNSPVSVYDAEESQPILGVEVSASLEVLCVDWPVCLQPDQEYPTNVQCTPSQGTSVATQVSAHHSAAGKHRQSWHDVVSHCRPGRWSSGPSVWDTVQHEVLEFRQCTDDHSSFRAIRQGQFCH